MFWIQKHKENSSQFEESDRAICLSPGGFYHYEKPIHPRNQMLCMYPYETDGDVSFSEFAFRCAGRILEDYPFVLESIVKYDTSSINCLAFAEKQQSIMGNFIIADESHLIAEVSGPTLIRLIPEPDRRSFECNFYGYRSTFSAENVQNLCGSLQEKDFSLKIVFHEIHDYLLIETPENLSICIEYIRDLCYQEKRKLFFK